MKRPRYGDGTALVRSRYGENVDGEGGLAPLFLVLRHRRNALKRCGTPFPLRHSDFFTNLRAFFGLCAHLLLTKLNRKVMQKSRLLTLLIVALTPLSLFAQRTVQLGAYRFVPEQNLAQSLPLGNRGHVRFDVTQLGPSLAGRHNALVQFQAQPTAHDLQRLEALGITLGDYVGGYAYYALV